MKQVIVLLEKKKEDTGVNAIQAFVLAKDADKEISRLRDLKNGNEYILQSIPLVNNVTTIPWEFR